MKTKYVALVTTLLIAGSLFIGCEKSPEEKADQSAENVKEASQEMKDAQAQYEKEWKQFKDDAELKISTNEKKIDAIKTEMGKTGPEFKAKYENTVLTLEQKNIELRKRLNDFKYDGKNKWEDFKTLFNQDIENVGNAINNVFPEKK
jgi:transcription-repair coupling factor (superfamily II helicase)